MRRFSYRSALTGSLTTRLVPVLARDATRMGNAARCRPRPPGRARGDPRRAHGRAGTRRRRRGRARAARLRGRQAAAARAPPRGRVTTCGRAGGGRDRRAARSARESQAWRTRASTRPFVLELGAAELALCAALVGAALLPFAGPRARLGVATCLTRCSARAASATATRTPAAPRAARIDLELEPGSFTVVAGVSGSGKSTLLRAACGLVPHFHGGDAEGELTVSGLDVREHGPGELAAVCGTVLQDPESQVVMSGVRAELSLPLEHRGAAGGDRRARGGGGGARARDRARCSIARWTRCRAASSSASRSPRRWCTGRRCSCSTSPPRSSTRWRGRSSSGCCGG